MQGEKQPCLLFSKPYGKLITEPGQGARSPDRSSSMNSANRPKDQLLLTHNQPHNHQPFIAVSGTFKDNVMKQVLLYIKN